MKAVQSNLFGKSINISNVLKDLYVGRRVGSRYLK